MGVVGDRHRHEPKGARSTPDAGLALPGVLLALVLLGAIAVASLMTTGRDRMTGRALRESVKAFYAAEAGANAIIAEWDQAGYDTLLAAPGDSLDLGWRTLENSLSYWGMLRRVDGGSGPRFYMISVTGRGRGSLGGQRVVEVVMRTKTLLFNVQAPMASITGMTKTGSSGIISGYDVATADSCPEGGQPPLPAAFTPDSSLWQDDPIPENLVNASTPWLEGEPQWLQGGTPADVAASLGIDWAGLLAVTPDVVVNSITDWPSSAYFNATPRPWPVIFVDPGVDLDGVSGQGLIVAPDSLILGGGFEWDGMVLVGDAFHSHGNTIIYGGIVSGLNILLGQPVAQSDLGNGTKTFRYHSCNLLKASMAGTEKGAGSVRPLAQGGWWQTMN